MSEILLIIFMYATFNCRQFKFLFIYVILIIQIVTYRQLLGRIYDIVIYSILLAKLL